MFALARIRVELHHHTAARRFQLHEAGLRELLGEVQKRRRAVVALGECRIELKERALEQTGLRRDLTVETSRGAEQTISTAKYEITGRGGKGRELLQRGQFTRVVWPTPDAPAPLNGSA